MAYCDRCVFWSDTYNELGQNTDDCIVIGEEDQPIKQFCVMYRDYIPFEISYKNAKCKWYMAKNNDSTD